MANSIQSPNRDLSCPGRIVLAVLVLGLLLRLAVVPLPVFYHADEIWQYMEPGYHLAGGRWVIPWEFREGIRSWLVPALLAVPYAAGRLLAPDTQLHVLLQKLLLVGLSLSVIASAAGLGLRFSRLHGFLAGFVTAIWFELVYFAPRALSESLALAFIFPAIYLLTLPVERRSRAVMVAAGLLLGVTFCVRFHLAPVLLVLALYGCGRRLRAGWLPLIAGGLMGLGLDGAIDAFAGETPFVWIIKNFTVNIIDSKSASFGTEPFYWYAKSVWYLYGIAALPLGVLAVLGARLYPAMFCAAAINLAVHSAIPHKEPRFILASTVMLLVLAALGSAELLRLAAKRWPAAVSPSAIAAMAMLWLTVSAACGATQPFAREWQRNRELVLTLTEAGNAPAPCGLAVVDVRMQAGAAYVLYNRDTPIYLFRDQDALVQAQAASGAFNRLIAPQPVADAMGHGFRQRTCVASGAGAAGPLPAYCLFDRPGQCASSQDAEDHEINAVLRRKGI